LSTKKKMISPKPNECVDEQFKWIVGKLDAKISPKNGSESFFCIKPVSLELEYKFG